MSLKGFHAIGNANPNVKGDTDGKVAVCYLSPTRLAVVFAYSPSSAFDPFSVNLYDIAGDGSLTYRGFLSFGTKAVNTNPIVLGAFPITDNGSAFRVVTFVNNFLYVATVTVDPLTNAMSITYDASCGIAGWGTAASGAGSQMRRRTFPVGAFGQFIPRPVPALNQQGGLVTCAGGILLERNAGSSFVLPRGLQLVSTGTFVMDLIGPNVFAMLSDGFASGGSPGSEVSIVSASDAHLGRAATWRQGNAIAGNTRFKALSPFLFVGGYVTGSQYATYAWSYDPTITDPNANPVRQVGGMSIVGALGVTAIEIHQLSPTRFVTFTKPGTNWAVTATVYDVNVNPVGGASPFTQVATFTFNVGTGVQNATSADAYTICAIEQIASDRFQVFSFNSSRNSLSIETFDLT